MELLISAGVRASVLLALGLGLSALLARRSAAERRAVLVATAAAVLLMPVLLLTLPERPVVPLSPPAAGRLVAEALSLEPPSVSPPALAAPRAVHPVGRSLAETIALAWAAGAALALLRLAVGLARARALLRRARPLRPGVAESDELVGPLVGGWLRPLIVLPLAAREWTAERTQLVLSHELAHVRRRDGLALLVAELAGAVYWCQPLAWLLVARLRRECELAADEDVVAGGARASRYAEHLLAIARAARVRPTTFAMASRPSELARRIELLLSRDALPARPRLGRCLGLGAFGLSAIALIACAEVRPKPRSPASAPTPASAASAPELDPDIQALLEREAERARSEWQALRTALVVVSPGNGAVLGLSDDRAGLPIQPASTLKPLTVALALDAGSASAEQKFDCGSGRRAYGSEELYDARPYGMLSVAEIVQVSSNVGVSRIFDRLGAEAFEHGLGRFHIEAPPGLADSPLEGAMAAIGHRVQTTPLSLALAYAALANDGLYSGHGAGRAEGERVVRPETARAMTAILEGAVSAPRATGRAAQIPGVRVAGKTGTSDGAHHVASFVGYLPADAPRYVIYVGIESPIAGATGGTAAAPVFARLGQQLLVR